jgi:type I restriction enzyme S subunit
MVTNQDNELPEGFKMTELGLLPEEWEIGELGGVADYINGYGFGPSEWSKYGRPIIRIQNLTGSSANINYYDGEIDHRYLVEPGDLLISWSASLGAFIWRGEEAWVNQHIFKVANLSKHVDKYYLFYIINDHIERIKSKTRGSTMKHVTRREFMVTRIPLPALPEQKAIARVLSTIQQAIETQDKVIVAARELKKSLMRHLFTYGPVSVAEAEKVPLKETEIGPIPQHWEVVTLKDVAVKPKQVDPRREPARAFKYVDVSGISRDQLKIMGFIEYHGEGAPHRARKLVRKGDVIFATIRPYLKRVAVVPDEFDGQIVSTAFCVIRCRPDSARPDFIFQAVTKDDFVQRVSEHQRGSNYPAVTDKDIRTQMIALPPIREQERIALVLSSVDKKIEAEEKRKASLQSLFKTMLHLLMTGKIRVKDVEAKLT